MPSGPLEGVVVGVTADRKWREQADLLERRGAIVRHSPTMSTVRLSGDADLAAATRALVDEPPDFLVATTGMGIRAWLEAASEWGLAESLVAALAAGTRIVARGPKSSGAVREAGLEVWSSSPTEQMEAILPLLAAEPLAGRTVALQEYGMENEGFTEALLAAGARVVSLPVYRWRLPEDRGPVDELIAGACGGEVDAITFTSAPAVHNLFTLARESGDDEPLRSALNSSVVAACVGPVCAAGARQDGIVSPLAPDVGRLGLLVRALSDHFAARTGAG